MLLRARSSSWKSKAIVTTATLLLTYPALADDHDPSTTACIAASEVGQELRQAGMLRVARDRFEICSKATCPEPIRRDCADNVAEIKQAMPSLILDVTDSSGNDVPHVTITLDNVPVGPGWFPHGTAVDLDPGEHTLTLEAPGSRKAVREIFLVEGGKQRRLVVILDRLESAPPPAPSRPRPVVETETQRHVDDDLNPRLWIPFGIGAAGLIVGLSAGVAAGTKHSALSRVCDDETGTCPRSHESSLSEFHTLRTISTIGYVAGALGVASGVMFILTAPKPQSATAHVWLGPASAGLAGRF